MCWTRLKLSIFLAILPSLFSGEKPVLRVTTGEFSRTIEIKRDDTGRPILTGGNAFDYLQWLTQRYHYDYALTKFYNTSGSVVPSGVFVNGSWDGVMGDLTKNVADIALGAFGAKNSYVQHAEITYPWYATSFSVFIPYPKVENTIWAFLKPFTGIVWLVLGVSFLAVSLALWIILTISSPVNKGQPNFSFGTISLSLLAVLTGQGGYWNYHGKIRLMIGLTWCTAALVIVNGYNGRLTSYLSTLNPKPIVSSLEDLALNPEVEAYTYQNSWVLYSLTQAESGLKKTLGDSFRKHPERLLPSFKQCLDQVEKKPSACLTETAGGEQVVQKRLEEMGKCVITNIDRGFLEFNPVFFMQKNSSFFAQINNGVTWVVAHGLQIAWGNKYNVRVRNCLPPKATSTSAQKLGMSNLSGPFVLLLVGYVIGVVVFIGENLYERIILRKLRSRPQP